MKKLIIPESDIKALEVARLELHKIADNKKAIPLESIISITQPMWKLTHRKYGELMEGK